MLKKIVLPFLFSLFFFTACTKDNREVITFSSWGSVTETKIINNIISDFEKKYPAIDVNFIHIPQNYFQKLHLLFASSTEPDVIFINNLYLPLYADYLENLDNFIDKTVFYPQAAEAMTIEKKFKAIPRDISNFVFFYNKDIVGNIKNDWSFDDFKQIIQKASADNIYGVSFERDIYTASPYLLTLGEKEGIEFYKSLEGKYAPTPAQVGSSTLAQMFLDGKIALYLSGRWLYPKINENAKFPFGIIAFPGITYSDASGWAISKRTKHKKAAELFVKYISSKECIEYFTSSGLIVPARKDINNKPEQAFYNAVKNSVPHNTDKNFNKKRDKLNKELFN